MSLGHSRFIIREIARSFRGQCCPLELAGAPQGFSSASVFFLPIPASLMARFSVTKCLLRRCAAVATLFAVLLVGCGRGPEITQYEVPKEPTPDRMLAALVPHGSEAWSFKLAGPAEAVGKYTEKFDALVQTVTFPDAASGEP